MPGSTENNTKKRRGNPQNLILWKPGQSGNPKGRKLGARNRKTVIMEAIRRLAEANNASPEELEELIQASGIQKAIKGSFFHYQEISNGLYGKITDKVDVTSGGKTLADLIATANANGRRKEGRKATGAVSK
jgi:hypothetical protein